VSALVELDGVSKDFRAKDGRVLRAVDGVSLSLKPGETLGIVGESGSGKSTLGRLILGLHAPSAGCVLFDGVDLASVPAGHPRRLRRHAADFSGPYTPSIRASRWATVSPNRW
jgi:peptide/nickel transport system ATP-binding protein